jgi:hypothetical protein
VNFRSKGGLPLLPVVAARPGLTELVHTTGSNDIAFRNLAFQHTDVDYPSCFNATEHFSKIGDPSLQACSWLRAAALHFEFCNNVVLRPWDPRPQKPHIILSLGPRHIHALYEVCYTKYFVALMDDILGGPNRECRLPSTTSASHARAGGG